MRYENITMTDVALPFNINEYCFSPLNMSNLSCAVHDIVYENIRGTQTDGAAMCFRCARNSTKGIQCRDITLRNVDIRPSTLGGRNEFFCENVLGAGQGRVFPPLGQCFNGGVEFSGVVPGHCL